MTKGLLAGLFLNFSLLALGQTEQEDILGIRSEYNRINSIPTHQIQLQNEEVLGHITDGGASLTGYFEGKDLVKAVVWVGLSYGNREIEYYLKDNEMFFAYEIERTFAQKHEEGEFIGWDYSKSQEIGFEGRYYFKQNKLIRNLEKGDRLFGSSFEIKEFKETADEFFDLLRGKERK